MPPYDTTFKTEDEKGLIKANVCVLVFLQGDGCFGVTIKRIPYSCSLIEKESLFHFSSQSYHIVICHSVSQNVFLFVFN